MIAGERACQAAAGGGLPHDKIYRVQAMLVESISKRGLNVIGCRQSLPDALFQLLVNCKRGASGQLRKYDRLDRLAVWQSESPMGSHPAILPAGRIYQRHDCGLDRFAQRVPGGVNFGLARVTFARFPAHLLRLFGNMRFLRRFSPLVTVCKSAIVGSTPTSASLDLATTCDDRPGARPA
jgi:hypothetical protein